MSQIPINLQRNRLFRRSWVIVKVAERRLDIVHDDMDELVNYGFNSLNEGDKFAYEDIEVERTKEYVIIKSLILFDECRSLKQ